MARLRKGKCATHELDDRRRRIRRIRRIVDSCTSCRNLDPCYSRATVLSGVEPLRSSRLPASTSLVPCTNHPSNRLPSTCAHCRVHIQFPGFLHRSRLHVNACHVQHMHCISPLEVIMSVLTGHYEQAYRLQNTDMIKPSYKPLDTCPSCGGSTAIK